MSGGRSLLLRPAGLFGDLARRGNAPALLHDGEVLSYADLAGRVADRAAVLGPVRRLVALACRRDVETVVTYLAALHGGHPVLLGEDMAAFAGYDPDVVAAGQRLDVRRPGSAHTLHPELAVLLSTSGSTGSPRLVRLSRDNLRANAASIADYLSLTAEDRALTTLPLHYCYGLSVLNSHLQVGAGVVLSERSVVDDGLWEEFRSAGATSFAGVPHTFDLLDRSGFAARDLPSLRTVTQAGGRLAPDRVRRWAATGRDRGFDFVVMYGQTEATARMAYLPPHLAEQRPEAIGVPIPGGAFRIDLERGDGDDVGELVYDGANVMLGYATRPADLALGRTVSELRTGDLARQHEDGLYELVGRRSRFAKLFGLRVDLDRVERLAGERGVPARAVEHDGAVTVFVTRHRDLPAVSLLAARCGLPSHGLRGHVLAAFPLTSSGKPDYAALQAQAALADQPLPGSARPASTGADSTGALTVAAQDVRDLYARLLGRPDATVSDSFADLQGDSLSYVEASIRLTDLLGGLPEGWAGRSATDLVAKPSRPRRRGWVRVETSVLLRAVAIVLVVATHANLLSVMGGAHLLLVVAGFNVARFRLGEASRTERARGLLHAAAQVFAPACVWILGVTVVTHLYQPATALLLNNLLGADTWTVQWQFWFLEAVVWAQVALAGLVLVPGLDRLERQDPYRTALVVALATLALRYALVGVTAGATERYALPAVLWCVALGWLVARSDTRGRRLTTSLLVAVSVHGFFDDPVREGLVVLGVLALAHLPTVPVPRPLVPAAVTLAASSLFVYLTHWQVYPHLEMTHPWAATLLSFAAGVAVWRGWTRADRAWSSWRRQAPEPCR